MLQHTAPVKGPAAAFTATKEPKGSLTHSEDVPMWFSEEMNLKVAGSNSYQISKLAVSPRAN